MRIKKIIISEQDFNALLESHQVFLNHEKLVSELEAKGKELDKQIDNLETLERFFFFKRKIKNKIKSLENVRREILDAKRLVDRLDWHTDKDYIKKMFKTEEFLD